MFKTKAVSRKGADVKGSVGSLCPTEGARYDGFPIESGMTRGGGQPFRSRSSNCIMLFRNGGRCYILNLRQIFTYNSGLPT